MICQECQTSINDGDLFCSRCGAFVGADLKPALTGVCGQCGGAVTDGDLFCRRCGASLKHFQPVPEGTLISVAKAVAHRLNNALSIVLTNSQLVMHQLVNPPEETREKLQDRLQDIAVAAAGSGEVIHQFQRFLDSVTNGYSQRDSSEYVNEIIGNIQPSCFSASLDDMPKKRGSEEAVEPTWRVAPTTLPRSHIPTLTGRIPQVSILIVDDEEKIRHALSYALTLGGHHVITASDGQEALALFQSKSYDLVFVDLKMPGMDGWAVASAIKRMDPDTMVVLITGWRVRLGDERLKESHVDAVITKPFELSAIGDLIAAAIDSNDTYRNFGNKL